MNWSGIQVRVRRDVLPRKCRPGLASRLAQMVRGGIAIGMSRGGTVRLALRCARDSIHTAAVEDPVGSRRQPPRPGCRVCQRIGEKTKLANTDSHFRPTLGQYQAGRRT